MTKLAIRVDDVYLDLFNDSSFYLTRQQRDLRDLSLRNSDYTRLIDVPTTPRNKNVLLPYLQTGVKEIPGTIEIDSISIDPGARFIVKGFDDRFTLNAIIDNQNIFSKISGLISELDFDDKEFAWTIAGISSAAIRTGTGQIQYLLAHWMDLESYNTLRDSGLTAWLDDQEIYASGFFVETRLLFDKIIEEKGWILNAESLVLASDMYNTTSIACPVDQFIESEEITVSVEKQSISTNLDITTSGTRITFDTVDIAGASLWDNVTDTEYDFVSDTNVQVTARIQGSITDLEINQDYVQPTIKLVKNSTTIREWILTQSNQTSFTISVGENIFVENGDELYFRTSWGKGDNVGIIINTTSWFKISSLNQDTTITINDHLPEITQADFIKGMMNLMNVVPVLDSETLYLYDFDGIFDTEEYTPITAEDMEQVQEYSFDNLYKLSWFKYKDSTPKLQRNDINYSFRVNDESLPEEGIVLELPFEGCDIVNTSYNANDTTALIGAYKYEVFSYDGMDITLAASTFSLQSTVSFEIGDWIITDSGSYIRRITSKTSTTAGGIAGTWPATLTNADFHIIRIKVNPRPVKIVYQTTASSFDIFDRTNVSPTTLAATGGGGGQPVQKATFNENMFLGSRASNEYAQLIEALKFPKSVQVWIKVPSYDILDRNFIRRIIYLPKFNERYYINKLEQWNPETQLCRAELIRIR